MKHHMSAWRKFSSVLWLYPAWFAPHYKLRAFFHRLRGVRMGKNVFVGYYCTLDNTHPEMITFEDNSGIAANSIVLTHDDYCPTALGESDSELKPVVFKKNSKVGLGVIVLPGVTIGENSIVGAYSVVSKDVPPNTMCIMPRRPFKMKIASQS